MGFAARHFVVLAFGGGAISVALIASAAAPPNRYTIANGTVYDTKTKLTWQQASSAAQYTWNNAVPYCPNTFGAPWRLPTYKELLTIFDPGATTNPAIDTTAFPGTPSTNFWSASTDAVTPGSAWSVSFDIFGGGSSVPTTDMFYVRCVL